MKKLPILPALLIPLLASISPLSLRAQFFKQILNTVTQTAQNRANNKASTSTNKAIDQVDSATSLRSKTGAPPSSQPDTAATNKAWAAFVKTVAANPNDTSASDLMMKSFGSMTAGKGVSPADSAAAIKGYMSGSGGSGVFYQYTTTGNSKQIGAMKDTTVLCITNDGNARSEISMNFSGTTSGKIISVWHVSQPKYSILLDNNAKTYSLHIIDSAVLNAGGETYQVTKIGSENIEGYPCVHARLISTSSKGKSSTTFDIWTSKEVPGYSTYKKLATIQNVKISMMQALENAGCNGFIIRMDMQTKDYSMSMLLSKAVEKSFPNSYFQIPEGYTESNENMMGLIMAGAMAASKNKSNKQ